MTKVEEVKKILEAGTVPDSAHVTITVDEAKKIESIVSSLFESRMRWIESAIQWHDVSEDKHHISVPLSIPEESVRKIAAECLGKGITVDDIAAAMQSYGIGKVREAGRFWGFHLGFLRTAIEANRTKEELINRIEDLHEAMTGHRREA